MSIRITMLCAIIALAWHRDHAGHAGRLRRFIDKHEKKWSQLVKASGVEQE